MAEQNDRPLRGAGFNTDPQTADWDELAFDNHNLNERVRGENTDTDDALAIYVQGVSTTTKVFNVQKNGTINTNGSAISQVSLSGSTNITLGAAAAAGSGTAALRSDATILAYDSTVPSPIIPGSVGSPGSSSVAARRDHWHGATSNVGEGMPALTLGTANIAGGFGAYVDSGATIQLYDGTAPGAMTIGGVAVQGGGSFAARSNHGHAIANTNVALLGGSWGSGPTLTNPQIAAVGWSSANHAHAAANSGGTLAVLGTVTLTKVVGTGDFNTTSATYVDVTGHTITVTTAHASNDVEYIWSFQYNNSSAASQAGFKLLNSTDTVIIAEYLLDNAASALYFKATLHGIVSQAASAKVVKGQGKVSAGTLNVYGSASVGPYVLRALEVRSN